MNVFGIVLLVGALGLCGYMTYTLIRDVRLIRKRKKEEKLNEHSDGNH